MHSLYFIVLTTLLSSCATSDDASVTVHIHGTLKNVMHEGDISAKFDLTDIMNEQHIYALGAVESLKGEILILDSKPYVSSLLDENLVIDREYSHKATLLVHASVAEWGEHQLPAVIHNSGSLEKFIDSLASEQGLDIEKPFPFLIKGVVTSFDWHVIDWLEGDTEHTHKKHVESGLNGTVKDTEATILGFYSRHHHRVFTHHSTNVHMHVLTSDEQLAGHVDRLLPGPDMTLFLPLVK